ncbi:hypothetical protein EZV62_007083 [Acer yangbiense]|uniref:PGG domain-containing protein n=1 Tax=Acer yangbiense TaxID=1000413 RepID=A0A5C7I9K3_9ROSI|nr:hypothetical protein EZV62_007083 [Acer yangbiense]
MSVDGSSFSKSQMDLEVQLKERTKKRMNASKVKIGLYRPLIRAILENDLKAQRDFLSKYPEAIKDEIDEFGNTIFHLIVQASVNSASIKLLKELVSKVSKDFPKTLEIANVNNLTALHVAASAGNTKAVKLFLKMNKDLLIGTKVYQEEMNSTKEDLGDIELLPVHHAAFWAQEETVQYLLSGTGGWTDNFAKDSGDLLFKMLIEANLNGVALKLLKHYPDQLANPKENVFWNIIVDMLSEKYLAFKSGRRLGFWESLIYDCIPVKDDQDHVAWPPSEDSDLEMQNHKSSTNCPEEFPTLPQKAATIDAFGKRLFIGMWHALIHLVPGLKRIHDNKLMHTQTLEIVRLMISNVDWTYKKASKRLKKPVLTAAKLGIHEFVKEVLEAYPNSFLFYDKKGRNIFLLAVLYRKEKVFSLIHDQVASIRDYTNYVKEKEKLRNILHLAGELVPSSHVPGAALQMQRELQWFKGIRDLFQPFLQEQRNKFGKNPGEVFTKKHKKLMENGEKWMRETATSCSVVSALIITIVFAAAFTVPGGINSNGIPNYLNRTYFRIFAVSLAIALFASTTSVQMFLGMLTSRYAEEDFLEALPRKLIIGLITLFLSSSSMMVAFGAAFCIAISHPWKWVIILICLLGCLPVTLFAWMQFPLLVDIFRSTYGPSIFKSMKR